MSKITTFSLTLLSTLVLTACGSSGGGNPHHTQQADAPKVGHQQSKDQSQPQPKEQAQPQPKEPVQTQPKEQAQAQPQSKEPVQPQPKEQAQPQPKEPVQPQPKEQVQPQPKEPVQPQPKEPVQPQPKEPVQPQPKEPVQPQPKEPVQPQPKEPVQPQPKEPVQPQPKEQAQPPFNDEDTFNHLHQYGSDLSRQNLIRLSLEGKNIELSAFDKNIHLIKYSINALRDNQGNLVGYYGDAILNESKQNPKNPSDKTDQITELHYLPLLDIDQRQPITIPSKNLRYKGEMHYNYTAIPDAGLRREQVIADYDMAKKQVSLLIQHPEGTPWILGKNNKQYGIDVGENGEIIGKLYLNSKPDAYFIGNFYGKNGEIIAGTTESIEQQDKQKAWKGVVGAKAIQ